MKKAILFAFSCVLILGAAAQSDFEVFASGSLKQVQEAIKKGTSVNEKGLNGRKPLMTAAEYNPDPEVISAMIKSGAKVDDKDSMGMSALMFAVQSNKNPKVAEALIKAGARLEDRDLSGNTPLLIALRTDKGVELV